MNCDTCGVNPREQDHREWCRHGTGWAKPSPEAIERIMAAAPDLAPELMTRLLNVKACIEAALADERVNEVGLAWLRTAHAKITGVDE